MGARTHVPKLRLDASELEEEEVERKLDCLRFGTFCSGPMRTLHSLTDKGLNSFRYFGIMLLLQS